MCALMNPNSLSIFIQDIRKIAEEAVPRAAENLALSLGALCMVSVFLLLFMSMIVRYIAQLEIIVNNLISYQH
jgi:hypothetical protein